MNLQNWVLQNIIDFNNKIKSEEDVKIKILIPFLEELGYKTSEMRFENTIDVQIGSKKVQVRSDIEIFVDDNVQLIIDTKASKVSISEKEILQSSSYAKLISTPPAVYAVTTNGLDCVAINIYSGKRSSEIPTKEQLVRDVNKTRKRELSEIEIREIKSILLTLYNPEELFKIISKCKTIIEKKALIRSDQSFKEMTKILLVKMNEEKRSKNGDSNRFISELITRWAKSEDVTELEIFKNLFQDAKNSYPTIYSLSEEQLKITDNESIVEIIKLLETWSFLGTGDDIKGIVYEIFLKSTLRGELDQYFTPREIVNYMVKYSDPQIGDKILDPACGSGGFLIQSFRHVNQQIINSPSSEIESEKRFKCLVDKCLWGNEADEDLHVLAKINLIMHGDGYNNIYQGDTLRSKKLPDDYFDFVLTNPPFTIRYNFPNVLSNYEMGINKESEELDILFTEKCIKSLNSSRTGELYIVLPEGLLNLKSYIGFREWLLKQCYIRMVVSLPEGAFIPFGKSVSKTTIIGLRKKHPLNIETNKPNKVFLGNAKEIGYETGKTIYKIKRQNDLDEFLIKSQSCFEGVFETESGGECGWINQDEITVKRIDASYLLNAIDRAALHKHFDNLISLSDICEINNVSYTPSDSQMYYYLEIPDISPDTGTISNIRYIKGSQINSSMYCFSGGDLIYSRINPRKNRVTVIPDSIKVGVVSKEVYILRLKENKYINNKYVLCALLQSKAVKNQLVRLATGSSSSRARVPENDMLEFVYIPIPTKEIQEKINMIFKQILDNYWNSSQKFIDGFIEIHNELMSDFQRNDINKI
ncbi:putative type I restriction enzymeP M protein [termite gut metagenome]|uniref:Putative type I restriction enzymeP M protein n=1 Tax=termite gut metagenome TaxID=433724 RepID=A0A5J4S3Y6_9ZZZZ